MSRLRLGTYNIHGCVGIDGAFRPGRIATVLKQINADVFALQEVERRDSDGGDVLDFLAAETGMTPIASPTFLRDGHDYGNAVLSKLPIVRVARHDLATPDREPRGAIDAFLDCNGQRLRVISTHLGLRPFERRQQIRTILTQLELRTSDYTVLMGDLNEWLLWGRPLRWLRGHFVPTPNIRTFPSRWPLLALDQLWVKPDTALARLSSWKSELARKASDHLPLIADLTV